jgi:F1F0 ATPase subunit 2
MTMTEWWTPAMTWALAAMAGVLLGAMFYGGLWYTVRKGLSSPRPAAWFLGSLLLRTGITLAGFYGVSGGQGDRLLACLLGFVLARFLVTRLTRGRVSPRRDRASLAEICRHDTAAQEAGHAA